MSDAANVVDHFADEEDDILDDDILDFDPSPRRVLARPTSASFLRGLRLQHFYSKKRVNLDERDNSSTSDAVPTDVPTAESAVAAGPNESDGISKGSFSLPETIPSTAFRSDRPSQGFHSYETDSDSSDGCFANDEDDRMGDGDVSVHGSLSTISSVDESDLTALNDEEKRRRKVKEKLKEERRRLSRKGREKEEENYRKIIQFAETFKPKKDSKITLLTSEFLSPRRSPSLPANSFPSERLSTECSPSPPQSSPSPPRNTPSPDLVSSFQSQLSLSPNVSSPSPIRHPSCLSEVPADTKILRLPDNFMSSLLFAAATGTTATTTAAISTTSTVVVNEERAVKPKPQHIQRKISSRCKEAVVDDGGDDPFLLSGRSASPNLLPKAFRKKREMLSRPDEECLFAGNGKFKHWPLERNSSGTKVPTGNTVKIELLPRCMNLIQLKDLLDFTGKNVIVKIKLVKEESTSTAHVKFRDEATAINAISFLDGCVLKPTDEPLSCSLT